MAKAMGKSLVSLAANPADVSDFFVGSSSIVWISLSQLTLLLFCAEVEEERDRSVGEDREEGKSVG